MGPPVHGERTVTDSIPAYKGVHVNLCESEHDITPKQEGSMTSPGGVIVNVFPEIFLKKSEFREFFGSERRSEATIWTETKCSDNTGSHLRQRLSGTRIFRVVFGGVGL